MTSELAIADVEDMLDKGLKPTPRDIIRLNAFGLAIEAARGKRPTDDIYLLPRVAILAPGVFFRQPTVGHEIWLDSVSRFCSNDIETTLALDAFALSRDQADLPDANDPSNVERAVAEFSAKLAPFCRAQIYTAIDYVVNGRDPADGERSVRVPSEFASTDGSEDWDESVALGILHKGAALITGTTLADLKKMTLRQLRETMRWTAAYHGIELMDPSKHATAQYFGVLDEIKSRLTKEKEDGEQH